MNNARNHKHMKVLTLHSYTFQKRIQSLEQVLPLNNDIFSVDCKVIIENRNISVVNLRGQWETRKQRLILWKLKAYESQIMIFLIEIGRWIWKFSTWKSKPNLEKLKFKRRLTQSSTIGRPTATSVSISSKLVTFIFVSSSLNF